MVKFDEKDPSKYTEEKILSLSETNTVEHGLLQILKYGEEKMAKPIE